MARESPTHAVVSFFPCSRPITAVLPLFSASMPLQLDSRESTCSTRASVIQSVSHTPVISSPINGVLPLFLASMPLQMDSRESEFTALTTGVVCGTVSAFCVGCIQTAVSPPTFRQQRVHLHLDSSASTCIFNSSKSTCSASIGLGQHSPQHCHRSQAATSLSINAWMQLDNRDFAHKESYKAWATHPSALCLPTTEAKMTQS